MANKGGGETLDNIGSFLGNAFIPETMARFRTMNEMSKQRAAISSLIDSSGIAAADPTIELMRTATPAFDAAFLQSRIAQMFPAPMTKDDYVGTPGDGGVMNARTGKIVPGTQVAKSQQDPEFLRILTAYQGMPDGDPRKAMVKAWLEKNTKDGSGEPLVEVFDPSSPSGSRLIPRSQASGMSAPAPGRQGPQQLENTLRDEFNKQAGDFSALRSNYSKIRTAQKADTAAGDLSLIFGYMKMLDPGSVVREGEFATAQNAGGISDMSSKH